jgi:hypothetical protein
MRQASAIIIIVIIIVIVIVGKREGEQGWERKHRGSLLWSPFDN